MKQEIFADTIGKIHFNAGMVRYDLVTYEPQEGKNTQPKQEEKLRIIMPPEGFLETFNTMQRLIDQLVEAGVLSKKDQKK